MTSTSPLSRRAFLGSGLAAAARQTLPGAAPSLRPNVLLISIDDLNDWVGCLGGHPQALTPNIDRLAQRGVLFTNAHCQAPICMPSRACLLTGLMPSTTGIYVLQPGDSEILRTMNLTTLPECFAASGYHTATAGKVFHANPKSGSFRKFGPRPAFGPLPEKKLHYPEGVRLWDWGTLYEDEQLGDYQVAEWMRSEFAKLGDQPFFLAAGFARPHVPLYAPQRWFDLYPLESIQLPEVAPGDRDDLPDFAKRLSDGVPEITHEYVLKNDYWKHLVQSYLASVSFVDHQVGRVLEALESTPHAGNTIVALFSDHGWHLGEKQRWAKRSLWERSTRVPLIVSTPGGLQGVRCSRPAGLVDVFPTLAELCSLKPPPKLDGRSLKPLLADPSAPWSRAAVVTSLGRRNHAVRGDRFRYIRYADGSEELYDHREDPHEWKNLAKNPGYRKVMAEHRMHLPAAPAEPVAGSADAFLPDLWR